MHYICSFNRNNKNGIIMASTMTSTFDYGGADFLRIREKRMYYVDRTAYIDQLENVNSRFLIFLRPRRFGKSLWISTMEYYYGLQHQSKFEMLFGDLAIGRNPTPLANQYLILRFNFSGIDTRDANTTYKGFLRKVREGVSSFVSRFSDLLMPEQIQNITAQDNPEGILAALFNHLIDNEVKHKIYILIDEYDHFANELVSFDLSLFKEIVTRNGWVRKFYETIKIGTEKGIVDRFFATGVSPITLDSMTSGFNIVTDITLEIPFNEMMGFTNNEVKNVLKYIGILDNDLESTMKDLERWYNGYLFNPKAKQKVFNPMMVLYFVKGYIQDQQYPEVMLDTNIASDYDKIRKLFHIQTFGRKNEMILRDMLGGKSQYIFLTRLFNFANGFSETDLISLLFYMGFLTVQKSRGSKWSFSFPNKVIETLYQQFFIETVERQYGLNRSFAQLSDALDTFFWSNDPKPFLDMVGEVMKKDLSNRDAIGMNEKDLKYLLISYLHLSPEFYIKSEYEVERKYNDILLRRRKPFDMPHNYLIELKYFKTTLTEKELETEKKKAVAQVQNYLKTEELSEYDDLKAWVWMAVGSEWLFVEEIEP
jgi:hypothetical protein